MSFTPTGSTTLSFSLGAVIGANGIYGQGDKTGTNDQVEVRFNLRASCSYTSGSRIAFRGFALSPCGATIRTASQYSGKIDIGGLPSTLPNYNLSQSLESAGDCEFKPVRNMTLKLRNIAANPSSATTEGIIVVLPPGASFNSMSNGTCNGTTSQTISSAPTQVTAASGDTLKWTMPQRLPETRAPCGRSEERRVGKEC